MIMTESIICVIPVDPKDRPQSKEPIEYNPGPEMVHINCEKCQTLSWIGPMQLAQKEKTPYLPILCLTCIFNQMQKDPVGYDIVPLEDV